MLNKIEDLITVPKRTRFYCGGGFSTTDYQEALAHGYDPNHGAFSFGYDFNCPALDDLYEAKDFSLRLEEKYGALYYQDGGTVLLKHPFDNVPMFIQKYDERYVGTVDDPYMFMDQGTQFVIFDNGDYTYILDFDDIASVYAVGFKVKKEAYYSQLNNIRSSLGMEELEPA